MSKLFIIIKPEGIIYFGDIINSLGLKSNQYDAYIIKDWKSLSRKLYGHYFNNKNRKFNYENLLFMETKLFGNIALCLVLKKFDKVFFSNVSQIKQKLRKNIYRIANVNGIYNIVDINTINPNVNACETLYIKYDNKKNDKEISNKGYFQMHNFSYIHMPDADIDVLDREYLFVKEYIMYRNKLNKIDIKKIKDLRKNE